MKTKNAKKPLLAIIAFCLMVSNPANAQYHYIGVCHEKGIKNELSATGIEYQNFNYLFNYGAGFTSGENQKYQFTKTLFNFDINLLPFHHALRLNRFVPYVGMQFESINSKIYIEGSDIQMNQSAVKPKAGLKLSYDRFITYVEYQFNNTNSSVNAKLFYVFLINRRCPQKQTS